MLTNTKSYTLRLHYNAVLYTVVSVWLPNIFPVQCVKNVSKLKSVLPVYFLA